MTISRRGSGAGPPAKVARCTENSRFRGTKFLDHVTGSRDKDDGQLYMRLPVEIRVTESNKVNYQRDFLMLEAKLNL